MNLILFDIDGTILKMKNGISKQIFSDNLFRLFGQNINQNILPDFHGMTDLQIINDIAEQINFPKEKLNKNLPDFWYNLNYDLNRLCTESNTELMPGFPDILEKMSLDNSFQLGLVTGNIRSNAYSKLASYSLESFFPIGAFGDDDMKRKNLPPIAIARANEYHSINRFTNSNSMLIGDSVRDIACGKSNSIPVLAVATGGLSYEILNSHNPEYVFHNLHDTDNVIETIHKHFERINEENNNSN